MKNGDAVKKLFGNNLELFLTLNAENGGMSKKKLDDTRDSLLYRLQSYKGDASPFDFDRVFLKVEEEIKEKANLADEASDKYEEDFVAWKEKQVTFGKNAKEEEILHFLANSYCSMSLKYSLRTMVLSGMVMVIRSPLIV